MWKTVLKSNLFVLTIKVLGFRLDLLSTPKTKTTQFDKKNFCGYQRIWSRSEHYVLLAQQPFIRV